MLFNILFFGRNMICYVNLFFMRLINDMILYLEIFKCGDRLFFLFILINYYIISFVIKEINGVEFFFWCFLGSLWINVLDFFLLDWCLMVCIVVCLKKCSFYRKI